MLFDLTNHLIEKACVEHYFSNIHHIYYFIDKIKFMTRCNNEMWKSAELDSRDRAMPRPLASKFLAVYNAVIALGALTAGESLLVDTESSSTAEFWAELTKLCNEATSAPMRPSQLPRELAKVYFCRARASLDDFFEACNLETQQALFLMSIFCMYALKPHASYMYHGMALRTVMAIGASNLPDPTKNPPDGIRAWWLMYSHEMELCLLLGRETSLRDAEHYPVFLAKFGDPFPRDMGSETDENLFFSRCNTELAQILKDVSQQVYHTGSAASVQTEHQNRYQKALDLDARLMSWRANLRPVFDLDSEPLTESEIVTKRKIIFQLRFHFAQIMVHRPFLVNAANATHKHNTFDVNVQKCLAAARGTVRFLYDTFRYRPFFRTWWYATSYAFNASSIILYCLVTGLHDGADNAKALLADIEKALKIFEAMDCVTVAQRCAKLVREMLEVAEMATQASVVRDSRNTTVSSRSQYFGASEDPATKNAGESRTTDLPYISPETADLAITNSNGHDILFEGNGYSGGDDFFYNMMDGDLLDSFGANLIGGTAFDLNMDIYDGHGNG